MNGVEGERSRYPARRETGDLTGRRFDDGNETGPATPVRDIEPTIGGIDGDGSGLLSYLIRSIDAISVGWLSQPES